MELCSRWVTATPHKETQVHLTALSFTQEWPYCTVLAWQKLEILLLFTYCPRHSVAQGVHDFALSTGVCCRTPHTHACACTVADGYRAYHATFHRSWRYSSLHAAECVMAQPSMPPSQPR